MTWRFVKWRKLNNWHVDREDGRTFCGQLIEQGMQREDASIPSGPQCAVCKRLRRRQLPLLAAGGGR